MPIGKLITLEEAVQTYHLDAEQLTRWADDGTIMAGRLDGQLLLREEDVKRVAQGNAATSVTYKLIPLPEAVKRYNVSEGVLRKLIETGHIQAIRTNGSYLLLEEEVRERAQLIPLEEAARRHNVPEGVLRQLVKMGRIGAVKVDGTLLLSEKDAREEAQKVSRSRFRHLEGRPIRVRAAEEKYGIPNQTLSRWAHSGRIRILRRGRQLLELDEADVAYAHLLADTLGMRQGRGVLPKSL